MSKTTKTATTKNVATRSPAPSPARAPVSPSVASAKKRKSKEPVDPEVKKVLADARKISPGALKILEAKLREDAEKAEAEAIWAEYQSLPKDEQKAVQDGLKKKRGRATKPKDQPSQGRTAYNIFQAEALPAVKAKHLEESGEPMDHSAAMKKIGEIWSKMDADARAPYEEESKKEKETQKPIYEAYVKAHPELFDESGKRIQAASEDNEGDGSAPLKAKKKRAKKDPNAPKKAKNGYIFYQQAARKQNKTEGKKKVFLTEDGKFDMAACGASWTALEDKSKFQKLAEADKKRYEKEMAVYTANKGNAAEEEPTQVAMEEEDSSEVSESNEEQ